MLVSLRKWPYWSQLCAILSGSFLLVANGIEYGWPSPAAPIIFSSSTPIDPPPDPSTKGYVTNLLSSLFMIGALFGLPIIFFSITYLGRKNTILIMACCCLICWISIASSNNLTQMYISRFISGISNSAMYVTLPMYSAECSQPEIRGFFGCIVYCMSMIGVLVCYCIVPFLPIWASCLVPIAINIISISTFYFQPETPYYLLKRLRFEEARKSLERLRSESDVSKEFAEISAAVARQEAESGHILDLVRIPSNRKATLIMLLLSTASNMSGITVLIMNAQYLLKEAASLAGETPFIPEEYSAIVFAGVMLIAGIFGALIIDKFGRRSLMISSGIMTSFFLALLAIYYAQIEFFVKANLTWIPLLAMVGYALVFKFGMGLVGIVINGELFPTNMKVFGMALSDFYFSLLATISIEIYYLVVEYFGVHVPFIIFSVCAAVTTFLVWIYVPETRGKTLEEIQMILKSQTEKKPKISESC